MATVSTGASVEVGDLRISYGSLGSGDPPVLFIHGAFEDRSYFDPQAAHLAPRHRVIGLDLRGHGTSDVPDAVSVDDFTADISVMEDARLDGAVLCGHSMGGVVALEVASLITRARPRS